jgi:hypothetical protein
MNHLYTKCCLCGHPIRDDEAFVQLTLDLAHKKCYDDLLEEKRDEIQDIQQEMEYD